MNKILIISIIIGVYLSSGCITDTTNITSVKTPVQQTSAIVNPPPSVVRNTITIDPIRDFQTDSSFSINGSSLLNVTGTTDFPVGTELRFHIHNIDNGEYLCQTTVRVLKNASGSNIFSYTYDLKGNLPGQYRVLIRDNSWIVTTTSEFKIASELPHPASISIDSVGTIVIGKDLSISGTTEMPPGSEIKINTGIFKHPCPMNSIQDKEGERSLCGGSCMDTGFSQQMVRVTGGTGNVNIWNTTVKTTDWCPTEAYSIYAKAVNYTNVEPTWRLINLA